MSGFRAAATDGGPRVSRAAGPRDGGRRVSSDAGVVVAAGLRSACSPVSRAAKASTRCPDPPATSTRTVCRCGSEVHVPPARNSARRDLHLARAGVSDQSQTGERPWQRTSPPAGSGPARPPAATSSAGIRRALSARVRRSRDRRDSLRRPWCTRCTSVLRLKGRRTEGAAPWRDVVTRTS